MSRLLVVRGRWAGVLLGIFFFYSSHSYSVTEVAAPTVNKYAQCALDIGNYGNEVPDKLKNLRTDLLAQIKAASVIQSPLDSAGLKTFAQVLLLVRAWNQLAPPELETLAKLIKRFSSKQGDFSLNTIIGQIDQLITGATDLMQRGEGDLGILKTEVATATIAASVNQHPGADPGYARFVAGLWAPLRYFPFFYPSAPAVIADYDRRLDNHNGTQGVLTETNSNVRVITEARTGLDAKIKALEAFKAFLTGPLMSSAQSGFEASVTPATFTAAADSVTRETQGNVLAWLFLINWGPQLGLKVENFPTFEHADALYAFLLKGIAGDGGLDVFHLTDKQVLPFLNQGTHASFVALFQEIMKNAGVSSDVLLGSMTALKGELTGSQKAEIERKMKALYPKIPRGQLMFLNQLIEDVRATLAMRLLQINELLDEKSTPKKAELTKEKTNIEKEIMYLVGLREVIWVTIEMNPPPAPAAPTQAAAQAPTGSAPSAAAPAGQQRRTGSAADVDSDVGATSSAPRHRASAPASAPTRYSPGHAVTSTTTHVYHHNDPYYRPRYVYDDPFDMLFWHNVMLANILMSRPVVVAPHVLILQSQRMAYVPAPVDQVAQAAQARGQENWVTNPTAGSEGGGIVDGFLNNEAVPYIPPAEEGTSTTPPWQQYGGRDFGAVPTAGEEGATSGAAVEAEATGFVPDAAEEVEREVAAVFSEGGAAEEETAAAEERQSGTAAAEEEAGDGGDQVASSGRPAPLEEVAADTEGDGQQGGAGEEVVDQATGGDDSPRRATEEPAEEEEEKATTGASEESSTQPEAPEEDDGADQASAPAVEETQAPPAEPEYQAPAEPEYQAPAEPEYQAPADNTSYEAPADNTSYDSGPSDSGSGGGE